MPFFTENFNKFFKELAKNNNRIWFNDHKEEFEKHVKAPFETFISSLIFKSQSIDKEIKIMPKEAIYRIYRDVRFSKNKTPYKTNVSAIISKYGRKNMIHPGIYVQLGVDGLMLASGIYSPDIKVRDKIRDHIAANLPEFQKILKNKALKENWGELQGEKNKIIPQEYKEIFKTEPLIANKAFYVMKRIEGSKIILSKDLDKLILKQFKSFIPLAEFFKKALK